MACKVCNQIATTNYLVFAKWAGCSAGPYLFRTDFKKLYFLVNAAAQ